MNWKFRSCAGLRIIERVVLVSMTLFSADGYAGEPAFPVEVWLSETTNQIVQYQQNPLRAARALAMVAVASNDAYRAGIEQTNSAAGAEVAAHVAAARTLEYLYPQTSPGRFMARALYLASMGKVDSQGVNSTGWTVGMAIADRAIARALNDGADRLWNQKLRPVPGPGVWRAAPPLRMYSPAEPLAGTWSTWILKSADEVSVSAPIQYGSDAYWDEAREVLQVSRSLNSERKRIADEWHLDKGSVTPAGVWNQKVMKLVRDQNLEPAASMLLVSALNVGMSDALIAAWHVKFKYWTVRPVNVIQEKWEPDFLPYLITPAFPGYVSGHAAVSGAAAEVIGCLVPVKAAWAREEAQQAAMSRLYGGIHFRHDNEQGLRLGEAVGRKVCEQVRAGRTRWLSDVGG
ncbi:MAG: vanadium-dependent haloperoxidase [Burkholderiales bacterium]